LTSAYLISISTSLLAPCWRILSLYRHKTSRVYIVSYSVCT
jgi:hypothetical protein